jgi:hypothetical protein
VSNSAGERELVGEDVGVSTLDSTLVQRAERDERCACVRVHARACLVRARTCMRAHEAHARALPAALPAAASIG